MLKIYPGIGWLLLAGLGAAGTYILRPLCTWFLTSAPAAQISENDP